jgi:hypothetical protein
VRGILENGAFPPPQPTLCDPDADLEEPIDLPIRSSTEIELVLAGVVVPRMAGFAVS